MDGGVFPAVLQGMLAPLFADLHLPQRKHLRWFVFGVLMSVGSSKIKHVAAVAPRAGHRTNCGNFLRSEILAAVTNETSLAAREIMVIYEEKRWQIEVLFKELRGLLGLCDYQVLSRNAIERHLHLSGMAHLLLNHHCLQLKVQKQSKTSKSVCHRYENVSNSSA